MTIECIRIKIPSSIFLKAEDLFLVAVIEDKLQQGYTYQLQMKNENIRRKNINDVSSKMEKPY